MVCSAAVSTVMKKIPSLSLALIVLLGNTQVQAQSMPYQADLSKWEMEAQGEEFGDVYTCGPCDHEIMLTIFAKKLPPNQRPDNIILQLQNKDEADQKRMAEHLLRNKLPSELLGSVKYGIDRFGFIDISDTSAFQYTGHVDMPQGKSLETFIIGQTPNTGFSITINYFYGDFDQTAKDALDDVIYSLKVQ